MIHNKIFDYGGEEEHINSLTPKALITSHYVRSDLQLHDSLKHVNGAHTGLCNLCMLHLDVSRVSTYSGGGSIFIEVWQMQAVRHTITSSMKLFSTSAQI